VAIEGSSFELGVISDPRAIRQFLTELEVVPAALKRISAAINSVDLGDGRKFAGDGKQLAEAFIRAARSELSGGNFQRAFRDAMSGVDLRIPPEAQAHLRRDLDRIAAEIRRTLPQQVQIGIRANTSGQAFREILQTGAPQAFQAQAQEVQRTLAEVRAQARQLRAAAAQSRSSSPGSIAEAASAAGLIPAGPSEPITPVRRFAARQPQRDQAAGRLEEQAAKEDAQRAQRRLDAAQRQGRLEEQASRLDALRAQRSTLAAQRRGRLEEQAAAEDQLRGRLSDPNSSEATLARAQETARRRRIAAQQAIESDKRFGPGEFEDLLELSNARRLRGQARAESLRGSITGDIKAGALGSSGVSFLERQSSIISTTASFALGGQLFQGVMNSLGEIVSGTRQFEEALSNLSVTFDDSTNNLRGFATEVGQSANAIGLTQAQGVEAASRSVGLFNTSGQDEQSKKDFAILATQVTGRIAQQSGVSDLSGVETNLAGILRSFELQNADLSRVEDSLAVISKQTGANPAELLQAASETATLARAAGFDAFQNSAIIANQATTTGQTAGSAAEQLAQVFAQATNTAVAAKFNQLGINTNAPLADQLQQLAQKRQSGQVSDEEFGTISALFGRSRAGAAFRNLVEGLPRVNSLADEARNSPGEGARQFQQVFDNISAEITKTVGQLRGLATELAQSGALDILAGLVVGVRQTASALTEVLHLFNEIPRPIRSVALILTELAVAARLFGASNIGARVLALVGGTTRLGQALVTRVAGAEAASTVAARFGSAGSAGPGLALLTNPAAIAAMAAVAGILVANKVTEAANAAQRAEDSASEAASTARTSKDLRGAASSARSAAQAEQGRRDAALGLGNAVDFFSGSDAARSAAQTKTADLFGRFNSPDEVTAQLQRLQAQGLTAAQRVQTLSDAFDNIASTAGKAGVAVINAGQGALFAQNLAAGFTGAIGEGTKLAGGRATAANALSGGNFFQNRLAALVDAPASLIGQGANFDPETERRFREVQTKLQGQDLGKLQGDIAQKIQSVLTARGVDTSKGDAVLTEDDVSAIKEAANGELENFIKTVIPDGPEFDEIRRIIRNSFKVNLNNQIKSLSSGQITPDQAANFFDATAQEADAEFNRTSFRDKASASATRIKTLQDALAKAKASLATVGNDEGSRAPRIELQQKLQAAQDRLDSAVADDQKVQLESAQALIRLRQSRRGSLDQAARLQDDIDAATAAVDAATDPTDRANAEAQVNNLKEQQAQLGVERGISQRRAGIGSLNNTALLRDAVRAAQERLNFAKGHGDAKAVADAQIALDQAQNAELQNAVEAAASRDRAGIDPRDQARLAAAAVRDARRRLDLAKSKGDQKAIDEAQAALAQVLIQQQTTLTSIASAKGLSKVPIGDNVAAAKAALSNAQAELKDTVKGTEAYYNLLAQIKQLRKGVTDTLLARRQNARLLAIDLTDPAAVAAAEREAAEDALKNAKGRDARDSAKIDVRQKRAAEEGVKFNQRLSDVQIADQLGRISHQQYVSYLQSEHDRLTSIAHRTRQQQDQLNQVDQLMKQAASELSGQFNIGTIKLPTVYEVRRAIKAGAGGIAGANNGFSGAGVGQVVTDNSQRTLVIQGVSIEEVMRRVTSLFGGAPVRTTTGRKG
jgi:hypothetical protein